MTRFAESAVECRLRARSQLVFCIRENKWRLLGTICVRRSTFGLLFMLRHIRRETYTEGDALGAPRPL